MDRTMGKEPRITAKIYDMWEVNSAAWLSLHMIKAYGSVLTILKKDTVTQNYYTKSSPSS